MEIEIPLSKDKIAIVVVGYNRLYSIKRLLESLLEAKYPAKQVPLVISIDSSGDEQLYKYVRGFNWPFGEKYVNIQKNRLGLKKHIFQCGDLTHHFKAIVLLEDDLFVSPFFYEYVEKTVEVYGEEDAIAEISLYKNESNGYAGLPFQNIQDGNDVFLMQDVSTWGQCWTQQMWDKFVAWRDSHSEEDIQNVDMPERIKNWERAWSKYYNAYVVDTGRHVLYPNISLTTNFSDAGEHGGAQNCVVQVSLLSGEKSYFLRKVSELSIYDIYGNNEKVPQWIGLDREDLCVDLYGIHDNPGKRYLLSTRVYPYSLKDSFALNMRPIELNVKNRIKGKDIFLYDTESVLHPSRSKESQLNSNVFQYYLKDISERYILRYSFDLLKKIIKRKLKFTK